MKKLLALVAALFAPVLFAQTGLATYNQYSPKWFTPGGQFSAINAQTGATYTVALTDANNLVTMNNASANTLTIPANATVAFPIGSRISVKQIGAGLTTITPAGGVTFTNISVATLTTGAQYGLVTLRKNATDTWTVDNAALTFPTFAQALIGSPTGGGQGAGTLNATGLFVNGVAVTTGTTPAVIDIQTFSTAGAFTWNKPTGAKTVEVWGCGSGGQGGGAQGAGNLTARGGGGGGGGGAFGYRKFSASSLPSSVSGTIGAGGTGAGGGSSGGAGSSPGGNGNPTNFGAFLSMAGGGGGGGTAAGAGGTPGLAGVVTAANAPFGAAGTAGGTGAKGAATTAPATTPLDSWNSAPGGGGGAAGTTGGVAVASSAGGGNGTTDTVGAAGTSSSTAPTDGGAGTHTSGALWPGTGGGGGGAGISTLAGKNGGPGIFCSGGGGGGAGSAAAGGNGGNGGDGYVIVITSF